MLCRDSQENFGSLEHACSINSAGMLAPVADDNL